MASKKEDWDAARGIRSAVSSLNKAILEASKRNVLSKVHVISAGTLEHGYTEIINVEIVKRL